MGANGGGGGGNGVNGGPCPPPVPHSYAIVSGGELKLICHARMEKTPTPTDEFGRATSRSEFVFDINEQIVGINVPDKSTVDH